MATLVWGSQRCRGLRLLFEPLRPRQGFPLRSGHAVLQTRRHAGSNVPLTVPLDRQVAMRSLRLWDDRPMGHQRWNVQQPGK